MSRLEIRPEELFPEGLLTPGTVGERVWIARRLRDAFLRRLRAETAPPIPPPPRVARLRRLRRPATQPSPAFRFEPPMTAPVYAPPIPFAEPAGRRPEIARIVARTAAWYGVGVGELKGPSRKPRVALPRQIAMYLVHKLAGRGIAAIGRRFGRDHTTALHALRKIGAKIAADAGFAAEIAALAAEIGGEPVTFPQWGFA